MLLLRVERQHFVRMLSGLDGLAKKVSISSTGAQAETVPGYSTASTFLSADGRFLAFNSIAANLAPVGSPPDQNGRIDAFVHDRKLHTTERVNVSSGGVEADQHTYVSGMSADGWYVLFATSASNLVAGDTDTDFDVFVHDRRTHRTECVSVGSGGVLVDNQDIAGNAISADGR
jgi:Tol biopolymer transport system component